MCVCERRCHLTVVFGGFNVCKQPTDWPCINLPFSLALSLSPFMSVSLGLLGTTGDICSTSSPPSPSSLSYTHAHTHVLGQWLKRLPPQLQPGFSATTQITLSAQEEEAPWLLKRCIALILFLWILSKPFTHQIYMKETLSKDACENLADEIECEVCAG